MMGALRRRSPVGGVFVMVWLALVPAAAKGQDGGPSLKEAVQLHFSAGDLTAARELSVLTGDYALANQDYVTAAQAYLDAAWIAIEAARRFDRPARHPYLAALRYGVAERYAELDRKRADLVDEANRLATRARGLAGSQAIGDTDRAQILGRVEALGTLASAR